MIEMPRVRERLYVGGRSDAERLSRSNRGVYCEARRSMSWLRTLPTFGFAEWISSVVSGKGRSR
jgi:hypothetical protein